MPVAATFRRISSGLGSGTGTSSIRSGSLYPYILAARIFMSSPPPRLTRNTASAQSSDVNTEDIAHGPGTRVRHKVLGGGRVGADSSGTPLGFRPVEDS